MAVARLTFVVLEPYGECEYTSSGTDVVLTVPCQPASLSVAR